MKLGTKRTLTILTSVLLAGSAAQAQDAQTSAPAGDAGDRSALASSNAEVLAQQQTNSTAETAVETALPILRRSTLSLPFDVPGQAQQVTVAHSLPAGSTYVPGSSTLNGQPIPDPKRGPSGMLYWSVALPADARNTDKKSGSQTEGAALRGLLSYAVNHKDALAALPDPTLAVQLPGNRSEVLQGQLNAQDFAAATSLKATQAQLAENAGAIKLPLEGSVVRVRDRISITVEAPQGEIPALTVNGQPVSTELIGTNTQDGERGVQRLTFVGVPIEAGRNAISFLGETVVVNRIGAAARIELTPLNTMADGATPIRIKVRALDAFDQLAELPSLTLGTSLEPRIPDSNRSEAGYQLRLVNGEGILELQPQSSPTTLKLDVVLNNRVEKYSYEIRPDASRVGVGVLSATVGLNGNFSVQNSLTWQAHGYYEGPLGQGKLYVAADKDRLPTDQSPLVRYPVYGDASTEQVPLQGIDPVALTYDHPGFRLDYRRTALPVDVLPVGEQLTALTVSSKSSTGAPVLSGFAALVPGDRISDVRITPSGTRILHLNPAGEISDGSETLEVVTLERGTGKELKRVTLTRNAEYTLDYKSGVVTLARTLDRTDLSLNEQVVVASYRLENPMVKRQLAYGVQVKKTGENYVVGAAAVSKDNVLTVGARAAYDNGKTRASALVAYSGGVQVSADVNSRPSERQEFGAQVRYQQPGYQGLGRFSDGLSVNGRYGLKLSDRLAFIADGEYHRVPTSNTDPVSGITQQDTRQGGSVTARADYKLAPFSVGLGGKYAFGDQQGFGVVGSVGYHKDRVDVDVVHTQPISGNLNPTTDISTKFKVTSKANLGFTNKIEWGVGQSAALTLDTMIGNVNYAVGYELPTASGAGNRARFSVGTTVPLNDRLTLGVRGNMLYSLATSKGEVNTGLDLNYKTDRLSATTGTDLSYNDRGFGVAFRAGVTGSVNDHLTLSADGLMEYGQDRNGQRLGLGYAYRARSFASLGYVRYVNGTLAGNNPELSTGLSAEYRQPGWAVRGGLDSRTLLNDKASFTWQAGASATGYVTDYVGLTAWGRMIAQPATGYQAVGYGVEGSLRVIPGTWLSAGYNLKGFDGLPSAGVYTKQGAYLRLDLTLDETLGRKK